MRLFGTMLLLFRLDPGQAVESALARKVSEPLWLESTFSQALNDIQHACGSAMAHSASAPAAAAFRSVAERLLRASGRNTIEVHFLDCGKQFFALTLGAVILVNTAWLARASEDDLWTVAAHEMAHRSSDFSRRVVIGLHVPGLDAAAKERLATEMEIKADAGALVLLRSAGRDPASLRQFLETQNRAAPSLQLRRRLDALKPLTHRPLTHPQNRDR